MSGSPSQKLLQTQLLKLTNKCLLPIQLSQEALLFSKLVWASSSLSTARRCLHKYLLVGNSHSSLPRNDEGRGSKYKTMVQEAVLPFDHKSLLSILQALAPSLTCERSSLIRWLKRLEGDCQGGTNPGRWEAAARWTAVQVSTSCICKGTKNRAGAKSNLRDSPQGSSIQSSEWGRK